MLETSNFVHGSAMWSVSLVMSECSLSGRGHGHVSNFYIVDLQNFTTVSCQYTGDIHNSSMVGLFMTPTGQWKWLDRVVVGCTCLLHFMTSICSGIVEEYVSPTSTDSVVRVFTAKSTLRRPIGTASTGDNGENGFLALKPLNLNRSGPNLDHR